MPGCQLFARDFGNQAPFWWLTEGLLGTSLLRAQAGPDCVRPGIFSSRGWGVQCPSRGIWWREIAVTVRLRLENRSIQVIDVEDEAASFYVRQSPNVTDVGEWG